MFNLPPLQGDRKGSPLLGTEVARCGGGSRRKDNYIWSHYAKDYV